MTNFDSTISFPGLGINGINPPQSINIGDKFVIHYYAIAIALGLLLAVWYGLKRSKQFGLKEDDIIDGVLCIVPIAVICARLYYCIFQWNSYKTDPISILYIWEGGLAIYGGIIGAALSLIVFARVKKVSLLALLDLVAISFFIGQSLGRWGNFFNREAFGCYTEGLFAMRINQAYLTIPEDASLKFLEQVQLLKEKAAAGGYEGFIQVHPTFLYESLWNAAGFVLLHFLSKKRQYDGQMALGYVAWYGAGRAIIESLRMDSLYWGPFRVSQLLAAISCIAAVGLLIWGMFRTHDPRNLYVNKVAILEQTPLEETPEETTEEESTEEETEEITEEKPSEEDA